MDLYTKIREIQKQQYDNSELSVTELSRILNHPEEEIIQAVNIDKPIISLNSKINGIDNNEIFLIDSIEDRNFVIYENLEKEEIYKFLINCVNKLSETEKTVINLTFGLNGKVKTQKEISNMLGMCQSNIHRIKIKALTKLKELLPQYIKSEYETGISKTKK